jgi:hypothetical protein
MSAFFPQQNQAATYRLAAVLVQRHATVATLRGTAACAFLGESRISHNGNVLGVGRAAGRACGLYAFGPGRSWRDQQIDRLQNEP